MYILIRLLPFLLIHSFSFANEGIDIKNLYLKSSINKDAPTIIYGEMENKGDKLDYLLAVDVIDQPEAKVTINKTIIEQNIARIIKIDRLVIPAYSTIQLKPLGVYLLVNNLSQTSEKITIKFSFKDNEITKEISIVQK